MRLVTKGYKELNFEIKEKLQTKIIFNLDFGTQILAISTGLVKN